MPKPSDILTEEVDEDPDDQLRMQLDQGQGNNLAGAPQPPSQAGMQPPPGPPPGAPPGPPPSVPGPLAALARKTPTVKPHIKLKSKPPMKKGKPRIKLKSKPSASNPSSALQGFLNAIATNPGS